MVHDNVSEEGAVASVIAPAATAAADKASSALAPPDATKLADPKYLDAKPPDTSSIPAGDELGALPMSEMATQPKAREPEQEPQMQIKTELADAPAPQPVMGVAVSASSTAEKSVPPTIESGPGRPVDVWSEDENARFVLALRADRYPPDWYEVAARMGNKSAEQCSSYATHFYRALKTLGKREPDMRAQVSRRVKHSINKLSEWPRTLTQLPCRTCTK